MLPEPKRRVRWLTREEADRLIRELREHLAAIVRFSLETGLRRSNVTGLEWSQVDLARRTAWIHSDQAKARKAIAVPLSAAAVVVIREQLGKHQRACLTFEGSRCAKSIPKLGGWRCGAWASRTSDGMTCAHLGELARASGTPLHVLQELGGWECVEMVRKYAHLSTAHLTEYVDWVNVVESPGGVMVLAFRAGKPVTVPYTATREVRNSYFDEHQHDLAEDLLEIVHQDVKDGVGVRAVQPDEKHEGPRWRVQQAVMGDLIRLQQHGDRRKPDRMSYDDFQRVVDNAGVWDEGGLIQILNRHGGAQTGKKYVDSVQFKRLQ